MCLDTVSKRKPKPTGFGWKVFRLKKGRLYGEWCNISKVCPVGKWLEEKDYKKCPDAIWMREPCYLLGWHIFKKKKDAKKWASYQSAEKVVRKIEYRKTHTQGKQRVGLLKCVVAKEIKILAAT